MEEGDYQDWEQPDMNRRMRAGISQYSGSFSILRKIRAAWEHPWFSGLPVEDILNRPGERSPEQLFPSLDLSAPVLFLARGHSGTTPLARILAAAGVYVGNMEDRYALNRTLDALYWIYGFQRTLLPRLFEPGVGCAVDEPLVSAVAAKCLRRHLSAYGGGPWGFKTGAGMFGHALYRYLFPHARYVYLLRDGRDVILSGNGFFHLTHPFSRYRHWQYFQLITFGISQDIASCPFEFPEKPQRRDEVMGHRFWVQAKSWREHVRMVEHLRRSGQFSPHVCTIRYEDLCHDPVPVLEQLFSFLELDLTDEVEMLARSVLHTHSIGRWKEYDRYISDYDPEDVEAALASMAPELELLGYAD